MTNAEIIITAMLNAELNPEEVEVDMDEVDVAFASGIKGLNETNKMIIKSTLEALLAKQEKDKETNEDK